MTDLLGFSSIALVTLISIFIALRLPQISKIIYIALLVRVLLILFGHYIAPLPDSTKDAAGLEDLAWYYGQEGFLNALSLFPGFNSFFYSWIVGIIYSLFGRSVLIAQSLSLIFAIGYIVLSWFIAKKIWDERTAIRVGWVVALFPSLILYSILPLREVYCSFFLLVATIGIFYWVRFQGFKYVFLAMFGFTGAAFFHGPLILGAVIFLFIILTSAIRNFLNSLLNLRLNFQSFVLTVFAATFFYAIVSNVIYIPKLGYYEELNLGYLVSESRARMIGAASYSNILDITSATSIDIVYKIPLRMIYFLFSPFPWDIEKITHIIGMIDGLLYMLLFYLILSNIKIILKDPFLRIILIILIGYFFMFSIGVSNFGAGLRHRTKFVIMMILLVGPFIPTLVFSNKNRLKKIIKK